MIRNPAAILFAAFLLIIASPAVWSSVLYVNPSATGLNNGTSWQNGFTDLQTAINAAQAARADVWVKAGVYHKSAGQPSTDSFEARNPNAVDIVGEEKDCFYTTGGVRKQAHLSVIYLTGDTTTAIPGVEFGDTTDGDSFAARLSSLKTYQNILVFANHPSFSSYILSPQDLAEAANADGMHAMEIKMSSDIPKWDYVLANLDDQAGDCSKIVWGVRSDDMHNIGGVNYADTGAMMGCIPTAAQDSVYVERRVAFRDMVRRGSMVVLPDNAKCGVPSYTLDSSGGSASRMQIRVFVENVGGATSAVVRFYGCDRATGNTPGVLLYSAPLTLRADNTVSFYLTTTGTASGQPLSVQQKANIKYIRPAIVWRGEYDSTAYLQPVRIRSNGNWWNGPAYTLAGRQGVVGPSPYPSGGTDTGETVYYNAHCHSFKSDGDSSPSDMRAKYWENYGGLDPTKPRFTIITDHNKRTPFQFAGNVLEMKPGARLYGGFAGWETSLDQRDWSANRTIIDAQRTGRCITVYGTSSVYEEGTVLDGFTVRNGKITGYGGGMCVFSGTSTISNCVFETSMAGRGGGLCYFGQSYGTVRDCVFTANQSSEKLDGGGGVLVTGSTALFSNCSFLSNTAVYGGGLLGYDSSVSLDHCTIIGNNASGDGGGLYLTGPNPILADCVIKGNSAAKGGGICVVDSSPTMSNCVIAGNHAIGTLGLGGGIYSSADTNESRYVYNTIVDNTASQGGGIYLTGSLATIANNIIAFNSGGIRVNESNVSAYCNNVFGNTLDYSGTGPGNADISADPLFADRASGDYHLTYQSPCIDGVTLLTPGLPGRDMDGQCRTWGLHADIGADEFWPLAESPKNLPDGGEPIMWRKAIVSAVFEGFLYIESDDRAYGIRVDKAGHGMAVGMRADVSGTMSTNADGERYIAGTTVTPNGTGSVKAMFLPVRSIGGGDSNYDPLTGAGQRGIADGSGASNIGLLVCAVGRVTYACPDYFYIEDGSAIEDGSGHTGIKVLPHGQPIPQEGRYVRVTGVSSCYKVDGDLQRLIRATAISVH